MNRNTIYGLSTGWLLIVCTLLIGASWTGLMATFDYPDVLRQEADVVLRLYNEGGSSLRLMWAGMSLSGFALMAASLMLHQVLGDNRTKYLSIGTAFGVAAGLFNALGFIRWVFATKTLADLYADEASSQATRDAVIVGFQTMNAYFGVSVGETLGYIAMGIWMVAVSFAMLHTRFVHRIVPLIGLICGLGTVAGILEWVGLPVAADINAWALQGWLVLLLALGVYLAITGNAGKKGQTASHS